MLDDASRAWLAALERGDQAEADRLAAVLDTATLLEQQRRDSPGRILGEALRLAEAGVAVFPIEPRGKRPLTRHGFKDATTDTAVVQGWWAQWPDANLGLPTGTGFDVIDIDGRDGFASMYCGDNPLVNDFVIVAVSRTSRPGGRHLYIPPTGRGNGAGLVPGVDYRGLGGYVVAPPSIGANGERYEWVQALSAAAGVASA